MSCNNYDCCYARDLTVVDVDGVQLESDLKCEIDELRSFMLEKLRQYDEELKRHACMLEKIASSCKGKDADVVSSAEMMTTKTSQSSYSGRRSDLENARREYHFRDCIWDISCFIGHSSLARSGSVVLSMLFLTSLSIQVAMFVVAASEFSRNKYSDEIIAGMREWRISVAHDHRNMDQLSKMSLASRACHNVPWLDMSEGKGKMSEIVHNYLPQFSTEIVPSPLFCLACIFLLFLGVCGEFVRCWELYYAVQRLQRHSMSKVTELLMIDCGHGVQNQLCSLSEARLIWIFILSFIRFIVCVMTLICGTTYLVRTDTKTDQLLGSLKLMLILRVNELIVSLAPLDARTLVQTLRPMPLDVPRSLGGVDLPAIVKIATVVAWLIYSCFLVREQMDRLEKVERILCGGQLDFVFDITANGLPLWMKTETKSTSTLEDQVSIGVATNIGLMDGIPPDSKVLSLGNEFGFSLVDMSIIYNTRCHDVLHTSHIYVSFLQEASSINIESCSDAAVLCDGLDESGVRARQLCAATCGCNALNSSLVLSKPSFGCPVTCGNLPGNIDFLKTVPCVERSPMELKNSSDWNTYVEKLLALGNSPRYQHYFLNLRDRMIRFGCGVVKAMPLIQVCSDEDKVESPLKSLRFMCPVSCGCDDPRTWGKGCPFACGLGPR